MILIHNEDDNKTDIEVDGTVIGSVNGAVITRNGAPHPDNDNIEQFYDVISNSTDEIYSRCLFDIAIGDVTNE